jgi:hypothetical protein
MDFQTYAARELTALADKLAETARKQLDDATAQLTANFDTTINQLRSDHSQLVNDNERLTAENAALGWEKAELIEAAKTAARGPLIDRLATVFERIGTATSIEDVLLAAAPGLTADFSRVAVFTAERRVAQLGEVTPVLDADSPLAIVLPIVVRGQKVATLVLADEMRANGEGRQLAEMIRRHVTLALDRLTIELRTVNELRAYAQMLVDEVEHVFNVDAIANLGRSERRERLTENLRCARQIYAQRVTLEGPAAQSVLDEVLSQVLDAKSDTPFGRELADVATAPAA